MKYTNGLRDVELRVACCAAAALTQVMNPDYHPASSRPGQARFAGRTDFTLDTARHHWLSFDIYFM